MTVIQVVQMDQEVLDHQIAQGLLEFQENRLVLKVQEVQEVLYLHLPLSLLDPRLVPVHFKDILPYTYIYTYTWSLRSNVSYFTRSSR